MKKFIIPALLLCVYFYSLNSQYDKVTSLVAAENLRLQQQAIDDYQSKQIEACLNEGGE